MPAGLSIMGIVAAGGCSGVRGPVLGALAALLTGRSRSRRGQARDRERLHRGGQRAVPTCRRAMTMSVRGNQEVPTVAAHGVAPPPGRISTASRSCSIAFSAAGPV